MGDHESHAANEPHNGRCANGADCGYTTIIDKAELEALRSRVNEVERERDRLSDARQELGVERDMLKMENEQVRRDLETRDAEVARLLVEYATARTLMSTVTALLRTWVGTLNSRLSPNLLADSRRALATVDALATPEATTPAVPEPKEMP